LSSKFLLFLSSGNAPNQTEQDHIPQSLTLRVTNLSSPTSKEISRPTRHVPS
jgi:hypothetical protein